MNRETDWEGIIVVVGVLVVSIFFWKEIFNWMLG